MRGPEARVEQMRVEQRRVKQRSVEKRRASGYGAPEGSSVETRTSPQLSVCASWFTVTGFDNLLRCTLNEKFDAKVARIFR